MRRRQGIPCHQCAPEEWRNTQDLTGSFELDAVISRNPNKDMSKKLDMYCSDNTYSPRTAYSGYHNYSGDN